MYQKDLFESKSLKGKVGIYCIAHSASKSIYIGQSNDIEQRLNRHRKDLERSIHPNKSLQSLFDVHGMDCFDFLIMEELLEDKSALDTQRWLEKKEIFWIQKFRSTEGITTLNVTPGEIVKTKKAEKEFKQERILEQKRADDINLHYDNTVKARRSEINSRLKEIEKIFKERWKDEDRANLSNQIYELRKTLGNMRSKHSGLGILFHGWINKKEEHQLASKLDELVRGFEFCYRELVIEEGELSQEVKNLQSEKRKLHSSKQLDHYNSKKPLWMDLMFRNERKKKDFY